MPVRPTAPLALTLAAVLAAGTLTACGGGTGSDPNTIKIAFPKDTDKKVTVRDDYVKDVAKEFEKQNKGKKVKLIPIQASAAGLRHQDPADDALPEDRAGPGLRGHLPHQLRHQERLSAPAGRLLRQVERLEPVRATAKTAAKAEDGKTYGVPDGTDTRAIWFNKKIFKKAGLPEDWKPKTWDDILEAPPVRSRRRSPARSRSTSSPGKAVGRGRRHAGLRDAALRHRRRPAYDKKSKKWVKGSQGFKDSLKFVETVYGRSWAGRRRRPDPNIQTKVGTDLLPEGEARHRSTAPCSAATGSRRAAAPGPSGTRPWA